VSKIYRTEAFDVFGFFPSDLQTISIVLKKHPMLVYRVLARPFPLIVILVKMSDRIRTRRRSPILDRYFRFLHPFVCTEPLFRLFADRRCLRHASSNLSNLVDDSPALPAHRINHHVLWFLCLVIPIFGKILRQTTVTLVQFPNRRSASLLLVLRRKIRYLFRSVRFNSR